MAGEETIEPGFLIDGKEYPIPDVNTFNLDEDELLWDYAKLVRDDFVRVNPNLDDAEELEAARRERLRHPGLMRTLLHIAYQRGNPTIKTAVVKRLIGQTNLDNALAPLYAAEPEEEADPLAQSATTQPPSEPSTSGSNVVDISTTPTPEISGNGSETGSGEPVSLPASTGTGR